MAESMADSTAELMVASKVEWRVGWTVVLTVAGMGLKRAASTAAEMEGKKAVMMVA